MNSRYISKVCQENYCMSAVGLIQPFVIIFSYSTPVFYYVSSRGMTGNTRNPKSPLRPHLRECAAQSRPSDPIFVFAYSRQNTKNPPKSPLRPPQLVPWFLRFIRISALMSKTRVLKCAISMTIMVVIAGQCDHFLPFPPFSAIACLATVLSITRNARKPMAANFGKFLQC